MDTAVKSHAKRLMVSYLRMAMQAGGMQWTTDNDAEVEYLVECIIGAAKDEVRKEFEERLERLENPSEYDLLMQAEATERARR